MMMSECAADGVVCCCWFVERGEVKGDGGMYCGCGWVSCDGCADLASGVSQPPTLVTPLRSAAAGA